MNPHSQLGRLWIVVLEAVLRLDGPAGRCLLHLDADAVCHCRAFAAIRMFGLSCESVQRRTTAEPAPADS